MNTTSMDHMNLLALSERQRLFLLGEVFRKNEQRYGPSAGAGVSISSAAWDRMFQRKLYRAVRDELLLQVDQRYRPSGRGETRFTRTWTWSDGARARVVDACLPLLRAHALKRRDMRTPNTVRYDLSSAVMDWLVSGERVYGQGLPSLGFALDDLEDPEDGSLRLVALRALARRTAAGGLAIYERNHAEARTGWSRPFAPIAMGSLKPVVFEAICPAAGSNRALEQSRNSSFTSTQEIDMCILSDEGRDMARDFVNHFPEQAEADRRAFALGVLRGRPSLRALDAVAEELNLPSAESLVALAHGGASRAAELALVTAARQLAVEHRAEGSHEDAEARAFLCRYLPRLTTPRALSAFAGALGWADVETMLAFAQSCEFES